VTLPAGRLSLALATLLAPLGCVVWPAGGGPGAAKMTLEEALLRRDRGEAVLVDVRSPESYATGHLPGAVNVPLNEIAGRSAEIRRMGRLPILYCG
jgi:hypothetical protein